MTTIRLTGQGPSKRFIDRVLCKTHSFSMLAMIWAIRKAFFYAFVVGSKILDSS